MYIFLHFFLSIPEFMRIFRSEKVAEMVNQKRGSKIDFEQETERLAELKEASEEVKQNEDKEYKLK